jgi:hypothetical protein
MVYPYCSHGSASISTSSTSKRSPGSAPFTYTGPVNGCNGFRFNPATSSSVDPPFQLYIEGVACLVDNDIARIHLRHRLDGLVPAVVPRTGLLAEWPERIDVNHMLFRHYLPPSGLRRIPLLDFIFL